MKGNTQKHGHETSTWLALAIGFVLGASCFVLSTWSRLPVCVAFAPPAGTLPSDGTSLPPPTIDARLGDSTIASGAFYGGSLVDSVQKDAELRGSSGDVVVPLPNRDERKKYGEYTLAEHTALEGCGEEEFLVQHLQYAIGVGHYAAGYLKKEHLHVALHMAPPNGLLLEFGVANGITANWLIGFDEFKTKRLAYHGFDSFKGLPTAFSAAYPAGTFARPTPPPLPASATLHVGWFQDTLPGFLAANPTPISFVHNDQDLYGPTKYVQGTLACTCRFQKGTIVAFDEYFGFKDWDKEGEAPAWMEVVRATGLKFRFVSYNLRKKCAFSKLAVQITEVPPFCQPEVDTAAGLTGKGGNLRTELKKVDMTKEASQFCEKVAKCDEKECDTR